VEPQVAHSATVQVEVLVVIVPRFLVNHQVAVQALKLLLQQEVESTTQSQSALVGLHQ
jgi:hypothetical protein